MRPVRLVVVFAVCLSLVHSVSVVNVSILGTAVTQLGSATTVVATLQTDSPAESYTFRWHFGDGSKVVVDQTQTASSKQSYTYANQGIFNVTVTVRSGLKEVGTGYTLAWVEDSLSAMSLRGETPYGSSASPSTLIASCHGCVNGSFIAYAWIFGDPSEHANDTRLTQTNVAQYQYPYAGIYPIQVVVANNISYAKVALNYTVLDPIGNVASIGPATAKPGAVVVFSISCTGSFPRVYTIEFGDGASESSNSSGLFTHTYNSTGSFVVNLTAQNPLNTAHTTRFIAIKEASPAHQNLLLVAYVVPSVIAGVGAILLAVIFIPRWYRARQSALVQSAHFTWEDDILPRSSIAAKRQQQNSPAASARPSAPSPPPFSPRNNNNISSGSSAINQSGVDYLYYTDTGAGDDPLASSPSSPLLGRSTGATHVGYLSLSYQSRSPLNPKNQGYD